jgi:hypothetical protein
MDRASRIYYPGSGGRIPSGGAGQPRGRGAAMWARGGATGEAKPCGPVWNYGRAAGLLDMRVQAGARSPAAAAAASRQAGSIGFDRPPARTPRLAATRRSVSRSCEKKAKGICAVIYPGLVRLSLFNYYSLGVRLGAQPNRNRTELYVACRLFCSAGRNSVHRAADGAPHCTARPDTSFALFRSAARTYQRCHCSNCRFT